MDENPQVMTRWLAYLLFPLACAVLVPLLLVFAVLFYVGGLIHGAVELAAASLQRRSAQPTQAFQEPHFDVIAAKVKHE